MSTHLFRNYIDLINENSRATVQLDEGVMDMLKPYIQKIANALMSKLDPETLQGLKQAYDQSGGNKDKFMAVIGITPQDLAPLAKKGNVQEAYQGGTIFGRGTSIKSKVLSGIFNIVPLVGVLDAFLGNYVGNAMNSATGGSALAMIFYVVSAALFWGVGSYNFGDAVKDGSKPLNVPGAERPIVWLPGAERMAPSASRSAGSPTSDEIQARLRAGEIPSGTK